MPCRRWPGRPRRSRSKRIASSALLLASLPSLDGIVLPWMQLNLDSADSGKGFRVSVRAFHARGPCRRQRSTHALTTVSSGASPADGPGAGRRPRLVGKDGQHLGGEALELLELIFAHEAEAEIGDAGIDVAVKGGDDRLRGSEAHGAAHVHAATIVGGEELPG